MATKLTVNFEFSDGSSDIYIVDATTLTELLDYRDSQNLGARHAGKTIVAISGHAEAGCTQINMYDNEGIIMFIFAVIRQLTNSAGDYVGTDFRIPVLTNTTIKGTSEA